MDNSPKYWVACSGGVDSVVLLHLMHASKKEVGVLHCNFTLRGESSNGDEEFVRQLAKELSIPFRRRVFDTKKYSKQYKMNTQLAARELRYNWFEEVIQNEGGIVLLAHHYDDQIETFFLQLRRGGKVKGLAAMPIFKNGYLRPLLKYTKRELIELAQNNNWKWREDISNASNDYTRNWYRNEVLPMFNSSVIDLSEVVPLIHSFQKILTVLNRIAVPNSIKINEWNTLPIWVQEYFLSFHSLGEFSVHEVDRLTKSEKGKFIGNYVTKVWNEGEELVFVTPIEKGLQYEMKTTLFSKLEVQMNQNDLFLDASKVKGELSFRKWKSGDRFQPLGMKGEKSVGKFLRDRKIAAHLKVNIQVLLNENEEVLGVFGFGVSEKMKVRSETSDVLRVELVEH